MARPCLDDHPPSPATCRICWLVENDPAHCKPEWLGGVVPARAVARAAAPASACVHLGGPTGETVLCPSCNGKVSLKVFACAVYGRCTAGKAAPGLACCGGACPGMLRESKRA